MDRLSTKQITILKEQFDSFDKDGDGKLTLSDTEAMMRSFGQNPSKEEVAAKHNALDKDRNGIIDFEEFVAGMSGTLAEAVNEDEFGKIFFLLDKDKDGYLNRKEIREGLAAGCGGLEGGGELTDDEVNDVLEEHDTDKDGKLSYDEFVAMMKKDLFESGLAMQGQ